MDDALGTLAAWQQARLILSGAGLLACMALEQALPFAKRRQAALPHYATNVAVALINAGAVALVFRGLTLLVAERASAGGWGLLPALGWGWAAQVAATVLALDALSYAMHVLYHMLPALWRLHQVHHSDLDFDVSTASRFHVLEILLSTAVQTAAVAALGAPPEGVLAFQMALLLQAQVQHSNVRVPERLERIVRWALVTPNMHRVHHSDVPAETDSNFSTILSLWDRLGGTMRQGGPQANIRIGLAAYPRLDQVGLPALLWMPLRLPGAGRR